MDMNEATELWNTWKGRYLAPDRKEFLQANPCNDGGQLIDERGCYKQPENIFGDAVILENGSFTVAWPLLSTSYISLFSDDELLYILKLRARWCALFKDSIDYRNTISRILLNNDRQNMMLNKQLEEWNNYLSTHGFELFTKNDLRGINLSGLDLSGSDFSGVNLAHMDLSFSNLSVSDLHGAYIYDSKLEYSDGLFCDLSMAILDQSVFKNSLFSNSWFLCSSFSFTQMIDSNFFNSRFDGAELYKIKVMGSSFNEATFDKYRGNDSRNSKPCRIFGAVGNEKTIAPFQYIYIGEK